MVSQLRLYHKADVCPTNLNLSKGWCDLSFIGHLSWNVHEPQAALELRFSSFLK